MSSPKPITPPSPTVALLNSFYRTFFILGAVFLFIGVPFIFYRKAMAALFCVALIAAVLVARRINHHGKPELSLKLFSAFIWLVLVGLIFLGLPPITVATAVAVAIMLCVVVRIRVGTLFIVTYMLAWGLYLLLAQQGLAPAPYFLNRPIVSWFIAAFAVWLVLLPVPGLVRRLNRTMSLQRATIEATTDGILVVGSDGKVETFNQRLVEMWGLSEARLAAGNNASLLHDVLEKLKDPAPFIEKVRQLYEQPELSSFDVLHLQDGRIFERNSLPQRLDGQVVGRVWSFRDVTASRQTEDALRRSKQLLDSVVDNMPAAIFVKNADTLRYEMLNKAGEDMVGCLRDCFIDKTDHDVFPKEQADAYVAGDRAAIKSLEMQEFTNDQVLSAGGETRHLHTRKIAMRDEAGVATHLLGIALDVTASKTAEQEIRHLAFYDALTHLPNRRLLMDRLRQAIASSARSGRDGALMFIDLDNFKVLNDTLGHDSGDELLQQVAERLPWCVRDGDTVARLGGDEFVVMLEELSAQPREAALQAEAVAEKILATLNQPYHLVGQPYHCTPSIGIALFTDHSNSMEEVMKRADLAMYQAKAAGRNCMRFFDPAMQALVSAHAKLEEELRLALEQEQFCVFYQAQVDAAGRPIGAEALVRWLHPERGMVGPAEFIALSEQTALILPLGRWVLRTACKQLVAWAAQPSMANMTIAVNVSARQFRQPDFVAQVLAVLEETGANPHRLKLELTESLVLDDVEEVINRMMELKKQGVGFSLDDFGTGYSSLAYLKRLPLDQLKIDRSFVRDVLTDPNDAAIARTIIALGANMHLQVVAEGVETAAQWHFLNDLGCHAYQGFLFGRPVAIDEFAEAAIDV